jgi:hypothetical protein
MHYHATIDHIVIYGLSSLIFFNVLRIVAAMAIRQGGLLGSMGKAVGGTVTFSGA